QATASDCARALAELRRTAPWSELLSEVPEALVGSPLIDKLDQIPTLGETAHLEEVLELEIARIGQRSEADVRAWTERLRAALTTAAIQARQRLEVLGRLRKRCLALADLEYEFLYDRGRRLLSIGYN